MKRYLLLLWLRFAAGVLDLIGVPHNFRRRIGAYRRKKRDRGTLSPQSDAAGQP